MDAAAAAAECLSVVAAARFAAALILAASRSCYFSPTGQLGLAPDLGTDPRRRSVLFAQGSEACLPEINRPLKLIYCHTSVFTVATLPMFTRMQALYPTVRRCASDRSLIERVV